jgi:ABC-2 type transport system ATP-binding protein
VISVEGLSKSFGSHVALSELEFSVEPGTVVGLLGRNGAGKTTCLRILAGVLRPSSGRVVIGGIDAATAPAAARAQVGYLPESASLYPELRVNEYLRFRAELKGLQRSRIASRIAAVLEQIHAEELGDVRCGHLSRGYRKRVSLADALLDEPPVLLLDEPTAGLDPTQNLETRKLITELGKRRTIIVSTHVLAEVEAMCNSVILVDEGRLIAQGRLDELLSRGRTTTLCAIVRGPKIGLLETLSSLSSPPELVELDTNLHQLTLQIDPQRTFEATAEDLTFALVRGGLHVRELKRQTTTLEQVFAALTQGTETP